MLAQILVALSLAAGEPFTDLDYDAALAKAKAESKLLLIDFTADWCPPCKKMDRETWPAEDVRKWLAENALALQVDVDALPELARRFEVRAMPTVVAMRDGAEFDRFVGFRDAERFLAWARDVRAGKRESDGLLERSKALMESQDVDARYELAKALHRARHRDEALAHYLWLWPASRDYPGYGGVRGSFMLSDMAELAKEHPPAREAFDEIFAELQARVDAATLPTFDDWQEWTAFCRYFGGRDRIVRWYESRRDEQGRLLAGHEGFLAEHVVDEVFEALMGAERPQDAVRLYPDLRGRAERGVREYEEMLSSLEDTEGDWVESTREHSRRRLQEELSQLYAVARLAERDEEAAAVAALLLRTLDTPDSRLALVRRGLHLSERPDPNHARWLDEAEAAGANVRSQRKKLEKLQKAGG